MKKVVFTIIVSLLSLASFAQQKLISYEDLRYLLHNSMDKADNFMLAKGYVPVSGKPKQNIKKYAVTMPGNTQNNVELRYDGKKLFISIQTNVLEQYNILLASISQYKTTGNNLTPDVQSYEVKNLANIYITINESVPYDALKKDYDIQIVPDKNVAAVD